MPDKWKHLNRAFIRLILTLIIILSVMAVSMLFKEITRLVRVMFIKDFARVTSMPLSG